MLAVPTLIFLIGLAAILLLLRHRLGAPVVRAIVISTGVVLVASVVGITLFEAVASWYRPEGAGVAQRTPSFRHWAEIGFFSLYAGILLLALGSGWVFGRAFDHRGLVVAVATGIAIAAYLTLTLPIVEFLNACHVGAPLLADHYIGCG